MDLSEKILAIVAAIGGVAGSGYWFRRWTTDVSSQLKELTKDNGALRSELEEMKTKARVMAASRKARSGRLKQLTETVERMGERIGQLQGSSDKVWGFLLRKFNGEVKRLSDQDDRRE